MKETMKKTMSTMIPLLLVTCFFTGCGVRASTSTNDSALTEAESVSSAQAYETDEGISSEEQEQEEKERREEIAEQYSIYEEFGLTYNKDKDRFFYNGNMVRYFSDAISEENTNSFFYEDGTIDLNPIRNSSGELTGLEIASEEEFAARTSKYNAAMQSFDASGTAHEEGNPDMPDDSLDRYSEFGISYDMTTEKWVYDGQQIYFFYDPKGATYIDYSAVDGVSIKVVRDKNQNIEKIIQISTDEVEQILD